MGVVVDFRRPEGDCMLDFVAFPNLEADEGVDLDREGVSRRAADAESEASKNSTKLAPLRVGALFFVLG